MRLVKISIFLSPFSGWLIKWLAEEPVLHTSQAPLVDCLTDRLIKTKLKQSDDGMTGGKIDGKMDGIFGLKGNPLACNGVYIKKNCFGCV
jgi:hypothetical protein